MPGAVALIAYSPHTWGWTAAAAGGVAGVAVFPTHVGMDRPLKTPYLCFLPYSPHTWGWTGRKRDPSKVVRGIPHTRGDGPYTALDEQMALVVFPTHVGMDRAAQGDRTPMKLSIPHTRGDGPVPLATWASLMFSIPHTRGDGPRTEEPAAILLGRITPTRGLKP